MSPVSAWLQQAIRAWPSPGLRPGGSCLRAVGRRWISTPSPLALQPYDTGPASAGGLFRPGLGRASWCGRIWRGPTPINSRGNIDGQPDQFCRRRRAGVPCASATGHGGLPHKMITERPAAGSPPLRCGAQPHRRTVAGVGTIRGRRGPGGGLHPRRDEPACQCRGRPRRPGHMIGACLWKGHFTIGWLFCWLL
jgi:hypothetical protein